MIKIATVIGARPQFIKAAVVSRAFSHHGNINEFIIHTGQHFDDNMSSVFFNEMEIPRPKYELNINSAGHGAMTGRMMEGIENILLDEKPDLVLVYGDTNSTLAGALAAKKLHIKLAHVEAGLRSFNMNMPEEINRILTDRISDLLFCPTDNAVMNLQKEGFENFKCKFVNCGDVMYDAALYYAQKSRVKSDIINKFGLKDFVLCTLHRAENTNDESRLRSIVDALNKIHSGINLVLPLHPRTRKIFEEKKIGTNFTIIDPVGYFDMLQLIGHCKLVMTDSGGLQKEAFFFNKNCITLRDETEWFELIETGCNIICGSDKDKILSAANLLLKRDFSSNAKPFGNGNAGQKIVNEILSYCS